MQLQIFASLGLGSLQEGVLHLSELNNPLVECGGSETQYRKNNQKNNQ